MKPGTPEHAAALGIPHGWAALQPGRDQPAPRLTELPLRPHCIRRAVLGHGRIIYRIHDEPQTETPT